MAQSHGVPPPENQPVLCLIKFAEKSFNAGLVSSLLTFILLKICSRKSGAVVALGAVFLTAVNLFAAIWGVSRLLFSLPVKGALPRVIGKLSGARIPRNAVLLFLGIALPVLFTDRISALEVGDFLSYSGLNFFVLYGLATAVAVRKLHGRLVKNRNYCGIFIDGAYCRFSRRIRKT